MGNASSHSGTITLTTSPIRVYTISPIFDNVTLTVVLTAEHRGIASMRHYTGGGGGTPGLSLGSNPAYSLMRVAAPPRQSDKPVNAALPQEVITLRN